MRNAFAAEITRLAAGDPRVVLLSADIGNRLFDPYKERQGERFLNCGVAEANMIGVAAGLALCGMRPVAYTITPFVTTRCLEQIRVDVAFQNLPVTIVGVGSGFSYAALNATHHSCEDIAFLRALPNMSIICPGDAVEVAPALRAALTHQGPVYIRLGKKNEPLVHDPQSAPEIELGRGLVLSREGPVMLLATGVMLPIAVEAARLLGERGLPTGVVSLHTVKPLDTGLLSELFATKHLVATLEEHSIVGGLGGAVAEWLADQEPTRARLLRLGSPDAFFREAGDQQHARQTFGLTAEAVAAQITARLERLGVAKASTQSEP
jgi:transketolase